MKINNETRSLITEACRNGMTGKAAAAKFGVSPSAVVNILREAGVETKIGRPATKSLDHNAFDQLTPEALYWIGFLFADGHIVRNESGSHQVVLDLAQKDRVHVEKFRAFLKSDHTITVNTRPPGEMIKVERKSCSIRVRSNRLADRLTALGIVAKGPDRCPVVEIENSADFWRGAVDGDGTVAVAEDLRRERPHRYPFLILCGHRPLLERYQAFLRTRNIETNIHPTTSGIFSIRISCSPAVKIIRELYGNATVYLDRKATTAREILRSFGE